jgi:phosphate transport system permease protein
MGIPSILVGLFAYTLIVLSTPRHYSGYAGSFALANPSCSHHCAYCEDKLGLVPDYSARKCTALGIPRWRMITGILFRSARRGLTTGVLLAIARVSGENGPLAVYGA